jgi:hypothetical protein
MLSKEARSVINFEVIFGLENKELTFLLCLFMGMTKRGHWGLQISCMLISLMVVPVESTPMKIKSH